MCTAPGGIMAILGELERAGLLNVDLPTVHVRRWAMRSQWDIARTTTEAAFDSSGCPGRRADASRLQPGARAGKNSTSTAKRASSAMPEHPFSKDGGLAVLSGNLALDGCIVKTAGVDESILKFSGTGQSVRKPGCLCGRAFEGQVVAGDVVVIRYEGPKGGPGMQEMLYPTSYLKSKGLGKACALITDGRSPGGTSGLSIGHASPEAAKGGTIGLVANGDTIDIDIPNRTINLMASDSVNWRRPARCDGSQGRCRMAARQTPPTQGFGRTSSLCRDDDQRSQRRGAQEPDDFRWAHEVIPSEI
jgi:dihydroxy-acid dehydratase